MILARVVRRVDNDVLVSEEWMEPEALDDFLLLEDLAPGKIEAIDITEAQEVGR